MEPVILRELMESKYMGCLVGMAVADAVGAANEFGQVLTGTKVITGMIGGGPHRLKVGEWTDDTSMALCLAVSLSVKGIYDSHDVLDRYARWRGDGYLSSNGRCFDIGGTTSSAISNFIKTGSDHAPVGGSPSNGSIMRLAPVPMFFADDLRLAETMSAESSRTTHSNPACIQACAFLGGVIARLLTDNRRKEVILSEMSNSEWMVPSFFEPRNSSEVTHVRRVMGVAAGSYANIHEEDVSQAGSVWATLEAALYTFLTTPNFETGALMIANRGDDSDTVGAVYGMIAGAYYGLAGIPPEWVDMLARKDDIELLAHDLFLHNIGEGGSVSKQELEQLK